MKSLFRIFQPSGSASMIPLESILPVSMGPVSCLRIGSSEELVCRRAASISALDIAQHRLRQEHGSGRRIVSAIFRVHLTQFSQCFVCLGYVEGGPHGMMRH